MNPTDIRRAKVMRCRVCNKHKHEIQPFPASLQLIDFAITELKVHLVKRHTNTKLQDEQSVANMKMFHENWAQYYDVIQYHQTKSMEVKILELSP